MPVRPSTLVTGGHGLLGKRVVSLFLRNLSDGRLIVVGRGGRRSSWNSPAVRTVDGDLRDASTWAALPGDITHVVHLAAVIPRTIEYGWKASVVMDNLLPLGNLIETSRRWSELQQIIYSSSVSVYSPTTEILREDSPKGPATLYAASKLAGEELLCCMEATGVRTVALRLPSLYANGQFPGTVLPIMVGRALQRQDIVVFGDGKRTQDFLHCDDAARAVWLAFENAARGVYNVGTGVPVTMTELARTISHVFSNGESKVIHQPAIDRDPGIKLDISKARRELGFQPALDLTRGLQRLSDEMSSERE